MEWLGMRSDRGYGLLKVGGRHVKAHRVAYELFMGEIPLGIEVHHGCENKACVNPRHLELKSKPEHLEIHLGGRPAANRGKTHCDYGHEFTPGNTYLRADGKGRECRECNRRRGAEFRKRTQMKGGQLSGGTPKTGIEVPGF